MKANTSIGIGADVLSGRLQEHGYTFYSGVPCSYFKHLIIEADGNADLSYIDAANEGAALSICAGATLAGRKSVCLLQNSGFGNLVNPLTSLSMIYAIPALMMISLRAYPDKLQDEPQHRVIGRALPYLLDTLGIVYRFLRPDKMALQTTLAEIDAEVENGRPAVLFVGKGMIDQGAIAPARRASPHLLSRAQAIARIAGLVPDDVPIVGTTGMTSRELFAAKDRPNNFYMQGSMGHASAIALGYSMGAADAPIVVLDGDGAALMHLGTLATIAHWRPKRLVHVILDNEAYATTGNQPTASRTARLEHVARACGYRDARHCNAQAAIDDIFPSLLNCEGPVCLVVKINQEVTPGTPRVTSAYAPEETTRRFQEATSHG